MPLKDYINRRWKVIEAEKTSFCQVKDDVVFPPLVGLKGEVKVLCVKDFYEEGRYTGDTTDTIKGDSYEITMGVGVSGKPQIHFHSQGLPSSGGSWTAEDQGPWPGDDE